RDEIGGQSDEERARQTRESLESGLSTYYGGRLASSLGGLGGTRLDYKPLFLFSEADPQARLVISRDLSAYVAFALALDLSDSEDRVYILDFHDIEPVPSLSTNVFTNENNEYGTTLQQVLELGRPPDQDADDERSLLTEIDLSCPTCGADRTIERRAKRAISYAEGERVADGIDFDVEVDVAEALRREGYGDPTVRAALVPTGGSSKTIRLEVDVDAGPHATFEFTGEKPPRARRDGIRNLYRADFFEDASLEEMREQTMTVWRSRGHLSPEVDVSRILLDPARPRGDRRVIVDSRPGEKIEVEAPTLRGLPGEVTSVVAGDFASLLSRVELAIGDPKGDRRLLRALANLGYPQARLVDRQLDRESGRLEVEVALGERQRIASIHLEPQDPDLSLDAEVRAKLEARIDAAPGDPFVAGRLANLAIDLERVLRDDGWLDARVRQRTADTETATEIAVRYLVDLGPRYQLDRLEIDGEYHTSPNWIRDLVALQEGELLQASEITRARRALLSTQIFETVQVDGTTGEDGTAITFDLREKPRYSVAYGLRWESSEGLGAAFDVADRNALGRGITLGLRAFYADDDEQSLRLYTEVPRILNSRADLELYAEIFEEQEEEFRSDGFELQAQLSMPIRDGLRGRIYARYRDSEDVDTGLSPPVVSQVRSPLLGTQLIYDTRPDPLNPLGGLLASIDLSGSEEFLGEDATYARAFAQLGTYWNPPIFGERLVWAQGVRAGYAEVFDGELPFEVRFFAGGQFSVRGYDSRSLGPTRRLDNGRLRALGGEALLVLNQELRYRVFGNYWAVAFYDAGNVWLDPSDAGFDLFDSVGLGVRAQTPIGLLRFDAAYPLDRRPDDDEYRLSLGFGHAF
ncbi:MAG: BamA/TamA family outer membrane protein, partial [Acidobacteriota bacterium]